jgi:hypothetical protein
VKYIKRVWAWIKAEANQTKNNAVDAWNTIIHESSTRLRIGLAVIGGAAVFSLGIAYIPGIMVVGIGTGISQLIWPGSIFKVYRGLAKFLYVMSLAAIIVYHPIWAVIGCALLVITTADLDDEDGLEWTFRSFAGRVDSALEARPYLMFLGFLLSPMAFVWGTLGGHILKENYLALPDPDPVGPELVSV